MRFAWTMGVVCLGLIWTAAGARGEQVDNPQYQVWTKFAIGSSETLSGQMNAGQMKVDMETSRKLVKKDDDSVTIEVTATTTVAGQQHTSPPRQMVINAKADKQDVVDKGNEKVDAAGKTFDCKVYQTPDASATPNANPNAQDVKAKIWVNGDVPGGLVKLEASTQRGTVTFLLKSFEVK